MSALDFLFHPSFRFGVNSVENFFSTSTHKRIRRGSVRSIVDPQAPINRCLDLGEPDQAAAPFE